MLLADLRAYLDASGYDDVEIVRLMTAQPVATDLHDPLVAQIRGIAERACNAIPKVLPNSPTNSTRPCVSAKRTWHHWPRRPR